MSRSASASPGSGLPSSIRTVRSASQLENTRALFLEYRDWLIQHREVTAFADSILARGVELLAQEIARLPGEYGPPRGELFLAYVGSTPIGCAALRSLDRATMEFKRLFVRPSARHGGVGRRLTERALAT